MRSRRGLSRTILEIVAEGAISTIALAAAISSSGYGASGRMIERNTSKILEEMKADYKDFVDSARNRRHFKIVLDRLKKDGLIEETAGEWLATGLAKSKMLPKFMPVPAAYPREKDVTLKIVVFDVPEKQREKRDWLRDSLRNLGFKMLQKSVWVGKVKLPIEFIKDLRDLRIIGFVDILAVTKTGSLRPIE